MHVSELIEQTRKYYFTIDLNTVRICVAEQTQKLLIDRFPFYILNVPWSIKETLLRKMLERLKESALKNLITAII